MERLLVEPSPRRHLWIERLRPVRIIGGWRARAPALGPWTPGSGPLIPWSHTGVGPQDQDLGRERLVDDLPARVRVTERMLPLRRGVTIAVCHTELAGGIIRLI